MAAQKLTNTEQVWLRLLVQHELEELRKSIAAVSADPDFGPDSRAAFILAENASMAEQVLKKLVLQQMKG